MVVRGQVDLARAGVVEEGEGDLILGADLGTDDDLVDVVELVPILVVLQNGNGNGNGNRTESEWKHKSME